MRPPGTIRRALRQIAWDLALERAQQPLGGLTFRDLGERGAAQGIGRTAVRRTAENMVRSGELQPLPQTVRVPDSARPLQLYRPADPAPVREACPLQSLMRSWVATA
jgi:hypothetical protein